MKNLIKISIFFVLSLLINTSLLNGMKEQEKIWVKTSEGEITVFYKNFMSHMNVIQNQINKGKGSKNDPVVVPIMYSDFVSVLYYSGTPSAVNVRLSVRDLQLLQKSARILEDYELLKRINEILFEKHGGVKA